MKFFNLVAIGFMSIGLAACATEAPQPTEQDAVVNLRSQTGDQLMVRTVDDQSSKTLSHFRVPAGKHRLEVAITKRGPRDSYRQCYASLTYDQFYVNKFYTLLQRSVGSEVIVKLSDSNGEVLSEADEVKCLPI